MRANHRIYAFIRKQPIRKAPRFPFVGFSLTPGNRLTAFLDGSPGSINGASPDLRSNRYGFGSGSFAPGIPRAFQFGVRVGF